MTEDFVYVECTNGKCQRPHDNSYEASSRGPGAHRHKVPATLKLHVEDKNTMRDKMGKF